MLLDPVAWEETTALRPSSLAWRAVTRAVWGRVPLTAEELAMFTQLSGGVAPPEGGTDDVLVVAGRRGFKTGWAARCGWYEARFGGHEIAAEPGQVLLVEVICPLREQAAELVRYTHGLAALPSEKRHVRKVTTDGVELSNNIAIKIVTADDVAVVSGTAVMVIVDEAARLPGEEATVPDKAILGALRPALAPIRGAPRRKFLMITSAYVDTGLAFETDRDCFGRADAPTLVLRGSTERFNPNIDRVWLEKERRKDPLVAMREYGDGDAPPVWMPAIIEGWFGATTIDQCVDKGRRSSTEPVDGWEYVVAVDAAFSQDNFAIAVAARRGDRTIVAHVDVLKPPPGGVLSPRRCVDHVIGVMRDVGATNVYLDQYAAAPLIEAFQDRDVEATKIDWTGGKSETSKAARYRAVREAMRDGLVRLPDDPALIRELNRVRGKTSQQGHESIAAVGRGVDDRVSATVMAVNMAHEGSGGSLPEWLKPGAMRGMAQAIQDMGGSAFSPASLGRNATAPFPGDAPQGVRGLSAVQCWNGEWEVTGSADQWPARFTAIIAPEQPTRHGRETHAWGAETHARWARLVEAWRQGKGI